MGSSLDLTGQKFGRLTVDECAGSIKGKRYWYCNCECGNLALVITGDLRSGKTKSCGCLHDESARERKLKHGGCLNRREKGASAEFQAWMNIKGKELPMVPEWNDYQTFFRDVGWRPSEKHELTRYDINEPHGPKNTYWRHPDEINNRRNLGLADDLGFCIDGAELDTGSTPADGTREEVPGRTAGVNSEERDRIAATRKEFANVGG